MSRGMLPLYACVRKQIACRVSRAATHSALRIPRHHALLHAESDARHHFLKVLAVANELISKKTRLELR